MSSVFKSAHFGMWLSISYSMSPPTKEVEYNLDVILRRKGVICR